MKLQALIAALAAALVLGAEAAESPAVTALKSGDFARARQLMAEEIKARPNDANLKKGYNALRATIRRRELFEVEDNPEMLQRIGHMLRNYYYRFGLFTEAEAVDRRLCEKAPSFANSVSYAVTLLNLEKNAEAAGIFDSLDLAKAKPGARLCAALAYARIGSTAKADALCAVHPVDKMNLNELKLYARIAAAKGDVKAAADAARRILENTPEKQHAMLKGQLFAAADFKTASQTPEFQAALSTASKVSDECATCPNRGTGKCDHGKDGHHHHHHRH